MSVLLRRASAIVVALSFGLSAVPPATATTQDEPSARVVSMLSSGCGPEQVAQTTASREPSGPPPAASSSPTPAPLVPVPIAPHGPQLLLPPTATPSPGAPSPSPSPSASPAASSSPGPVIITPETAPPSASPVPQQIATAGPILPSPSASPSPSPGPGEETLDPNSYAVLGDTLTGVNKPGEPFDLDGHVNIFYHDGVLGGDHAHYDGRRYIDVTGNPFVRSRTSDTVLYAESIRFDETTQQATLIHGRGESTQGVEQGKLHFSGSSMVTDRSGVTHVQRANLTTCENPRGGYHLESKSLDVYPGDKAVARSATLFLGALAIFYLPVVVISLANDATGSRRQPGFIPIVGYSSAEGFWVKARIGFSPSDYYYGYYRVEEYTKIGLGLGYVGTIRRRDGRRQTDINFFRLKNKLDQSNNTNFTLSDLENFSRSTRGNFTVNYTGNYGPLVSLPPVFDFASAVDHGDVRGDQEHYSFHRSSTGSQASENDYGFSDHRLFSNRLTNDLTATYTNSDNFGFGASNQLHYETLTHLSGNALDYDLTFDKWDSTNPSNVQREPELAVRPHNALFPQFFRAVPVNTQFLFGIYNDPTADLTTSREEGKFSLGPVLAHVLGSDFNANAVVQQDLYGTGDEKAQITQNATLTTPLFGHILNVITYSEAHVNGPLAEPFKQIDVLGNGAKQASDNLRIYNGDVYALSLTATTFFNRQAQAVGYTLTSRPSPRSSLTLSGVFTPGPGFGFDRTNVQLATPFGYQSDLQFVTDVDWKARGRLENKNIYYRHVVGNCYEIRIAYNQNLKQVTASVDLLAFPSRVANFGIGQTSLSSVVPQSFSTSTFTTGVGP